MTVIIYITLKLDILLLTMKGKTRYYSLQNNSNNKAVWTQNVLRDCSLKKERIFVFICKKKNTEQRAIIEHLQDKIMTAYIMRTPLLIMRETTNKRETTQSKNITSFWSDCSAQICFRFGFHYLLYINVIR